MSTTAIAKGGKKRGVDLGQVFQKVLGNINIEAAIANALPKMAPGIVSQIPALAQMGVTPDMVRDMFTNASPTVTEEDSQAIEIPSGGSTRFLRDRNKIQPQEILDGIDFLVENDHLYGDEWDNFLNVLYLSIGLAKAQKTTIEHKGQQYAQ